MNIQNLTLKFHELRVAVDSETEPLPAPLYGGVVLRNVHFWLGLERRTSGEPALSTFGTRSVRFLPALLQIKRIPQANVGIPVVFALILELVVQLFPVFVLTKSPNSNMSISPIFNISKFLRSVHPVIQTIFKTHLF